MVEVNGRDLPAFFGPPITGEQRQSAKHLQSSTQTLDGPAPGRRYPFSIFPM